MRAKIAVGGLAVGVAGALAFLVMPVVASANGTSSGNAALSRGLRLGHLVVDQRAYAAAKATAASKLSARQPALVSTTGPTTVVGWNGVSETDLTPSDSTGAIGPNSYVEAINIQLGIYSRSGKPIATGGFEKVTGTAHLDLSDPQMLWDTQTNRFYYLMADVKDSTIRWGFSKTANPKTVSTSDWCGYTADFGYGSSFPDFPKLGQSSAYLMIGANVFNSASNYVGSDLDTITKPQSTGSITSCPAQSGFQLDRHKGLTDCAGGFAWSLEPAQQAGSSATGWVTAIPASVDAGGAASTLDIFRVTQGTGGHSRVSSASCVKGGMTYSMPADAPQSLALFPLDTFDGSLLHAVAAPDPTLTGTGTQWALWTSHPIAGGAGSMVRWYEIHVYEGSTAPSLAQAGNISDSHLYVFNPAVSPDRRATGATSGSFGADAVIGVSTSSSGTNPAVQMVSKEHGAPQSSLVLVHQSAGPDNGFDCLSLALSTGDCRWGDYSGASPDPAASTTDTVGRVWLSSMDAANSTPILPNPASAEWGTFNWEAKP
jgi:hypothetical protein